MRDLIVRCLHFASILTLHPDVIARHSYARSAMSRRQFRCAVPLLATLMARGIGLPQP